MTREEIKQLGNGVYRIHWKSGGWSLASVGRLYDGTVWMAPSNWTNADTTNMEEYAENIRRVTVIELRNR